LGKGKRKGKRKRKGENAKMSGSLAISIAEVSGNKPAEK
jgi:hypothetical protein